MYEGVCTCEYLSASAIGGQRHRFPLELELETLVGCLIQVLGTELSKESVLLLGGDITLSAMGQVRDLTRVPHPQGGLALR